jgi:hypothetical protein
MKAPFLRNCMILLAASLAGCSTTSGGGGGRSAPGLEVARFHLGEPIARAQIAIEPYDRADANSPDFPAAAAAVERELTRLGWTVQRTMGQSEQIALVDLTQGSREAIAAQTSARIGRGVAPLPATGSSAGITATLLEVGIRRRSDGTVFWEGRAVGEARTGSSEAAGAAMANRLAPALFRDFPGESGRTIRIR